ncbi:MAG TPA: hypothetical protein VF792_10875 [Ktedonobacterales bacterium]
MIIRIHMEDQYRLSEEAAAEVDKLDKALLVAVHTNDATAFDTELQALLGYVRTHGEKVPIEEIVSSDLILPSPDMTLVEAHAMLDKAEAAQASSASDA